MADPTFDATQPFTTAGSAGTPAFDPKQPFDAHPLPTGTDQGGLGMVQAAVHGGTAGLSDVAAAGLGAGLSHLTDSPQTYATTKAQIDANAAATAEAHPLASALSTGLGMTLGAGKIVGALHAGVTAVAPTLAAKIGAALAPTLSVDGQALTGAAKLRNVAKLAGVGAGTAAEAGAVYGGVGSAVEGNAPGTVAKDAGIGAATGAVIGGPLAVAAGGVVAGGARVIDYFGDAWKPAAKFLAKQYGGTATDIQNALTQHKLNTGEDASMAEIATLGNRGDLAKLAKTNPQEIGLPVEARQQAVTADLPGALSSDVTKNLGPSEAVSPLETLRDANFKHSFDPVRRTPIDLSEDDLNFLTAPQVRGALSRVKAGPDEAPTASDKLGLQQQAQADNATLQTLMGTGKASAADMNAAGAQALKSQAAADSHPLTAEDMDGFRQSFRSAAQFDSDGHPQNTQDAAVFSKRADRVTSITNEAVPGAPASATGPATPSYQDMLDHYRADQQHLEAFQHGVTGQPQSAASATTRASLTTPAGAAGYRAGLSTYVNNLATKGEASATSLAQRLSENNALTQNLQDTFGKGADALNNAATARANAQANLRAISPGTSQATPSSVNAGQVMAAAAVAHLSPMWGMVHMIKALTPGVGLSSGATQALGKMLTDPAMAPRVPGLLQQAGASTNHIRAIMRAAAGVIGSTAGAVAGNSVTLGPITQQ